MRIVAALFSIVTHVVSAEIALDRHTGKSLGHAWLVVHDHDVPGLIAKMDRYIVRARAIHVDLATPRGWRNSN